MPPYVGPFKATKHMENVEMCLHPPRWHVPTFAFQPFGRMLLDTCSPTTDVGSWKNRVPRLPRNNATL